MLRPEPVRLRSVLFHHVSDTDSSFTTGLGVRMGVDAYRGRVEFLRRHYAPVSLDDVREACDGAPLPRRALLITFDDAYASVAGTAAPILDDLGVPSLFFVNGGFVDHRQLGLDNLVAHVATVGGPGALRTATSRVVAGRASDSIAETLGSIVPELGRDAVVRLRGALEDQLDHDPLEAAASEGIYLSADQLRSLPDSMAIGSHTASHVRGRALTEDHAGTEVGENRARLRRLTDDAVTSFSVPYGSVVDLTPIVADAVRAAGHDTTFLVEGRLNHGDLARHRLTRVSLGSESDVGTLVELEVLPRLRYARDLVRGDGRP